MRSRQTTHVHPVTQLYVPGKCCAVGHDDVIAKHAVMRNVRVRHEEIVTADAGNALIVGGAAVDGTKFAKYVVIADLKMRALACVFLVLRIAADGCELEYPIGRADARRPADDRMRSDGCSRADHDIGVNDRIRTDADVGCKFRLWRDDRARVNYASFPEVDRGLGARAPTHLLTSGATIISACATSSSPTRAIVEKRQMPLKLRSSCALRMSWSPGSTGFLKRALSMPTK